MLDENSQDHRQSAKSLWNPEQTKERDSIIHLKAEEERQKDIVSIERIQKMLRENENAEQELMEPVSNGQTIQDRKYVQHGFQSLIVSAPRSSITAVKERKGSAPRPTWYPGFITHSSSAFGSSLLHLGHDRPEKPVLPPSVASVTMSTML